MKKTKSPELQSIDKDISKLRGKLNLQRHRYSSLEIEGFEVDLEALIYERNELVNKEIVSNSLETPTNMPNSAENKEMVSNSLETATI